MKNTLLYVCICNILISHFCKILKSNLIHMFWILEKDINWRFYYLCILHIQCDIRFAYGHFQDRIKKIKKILNKKNSTIFVTSPNYVRNILYILCRFYFTTDVAEQNGMKSYHWSHLQNKCCSQHQHNLKGLCSLFQLRNGYLDASMWQRRRAGKRRMEMTVESELREVVSSPSPSGRLYFRDPDNPCWDLALITQQGAVCKGQLHWLSAERENCHLLCQAWWYLYNSL